MVVSIPIWSDYLLFLLLKLFLMVLSFYSNMVWLSMILSHLTCLYHILVSIPIWSDYLSSTWSIKPSSLIRFYSNMVWLSIHIRYDKVLRICKFLFQYGLIIYKIIICLEEHVEVCFYSNMVWLSICNKRLNTENPDKFLFQYGLIIYL